jgi:hypothetical protein
MVHCSQKAPTGLSTSAGGHLAGRDLEHVVAAAAENVGATCKHQAAVLVAAAAAAAAGGFVARLQTRCSTSLAVAAVLAVDAPTRSAYPAIRSTSAVADVGDATRTVAERYRQVVVPQLEPQAPGQRFP